MGERGLEKDIGEEEELGWRIKRHGKTMTPERRSGGTRKTWTEELFTPICRGGHSNPKHSTRELQRRG